MICIYMNRYIQFVTMLSVTIYGVVVIPICNQYVTIMVLYEHNAVNSYNSDNQFVTYYGKRL